MQNFKEKSLVTRCFSGGYAKVSYTQRTKRMRVSVIIPTCQGANYIAETLDSITTQSMLPFEIVISDDESSDGTIEIVKAYIKSSPCPIKLTRHTQTGISANYLNALNHTSGEIIVVGDHDDVWLPNKIQSIHDIFLRFEDVSIVSSDSAIVDISLGRTGRTLRGNENISFKLASLSIKDDFRQFLVGLPLDAHTLAFRSTVKDLLTDQLLGSVQNFWFEEKVATVAMSLGKLMLIPDVLTLYRQHPAQHVGYKHQQSKSKFNLERRIESRIEKLYVLKIMLLSNRQYYLFNEAEARKRIALIDEYINFTNVRNPVEFKVSSIIKMTRCLLNGSYKRFTRNWSRSFVKDVYLMVVKVALRTMLFALCTLLKTYE